MDAFLQPEKLDEADSWYCTSCKAHVQAEKKLDLWRLPEVLVVHLKRFSYSRYSRDKIDTEVDFPLEGLDLRSVVPVSEGGTRGESTAGAAGKDNAGITAANAAAAAPLPAPVYDLYAVSNHYGGLGGGHYTAYCRMPDDGKWYTFDDSSVAEMREESVKSPAAYVLFYRRRGMRESDIEAVVAAAATEGASGSGGGDSTLDVDMATGGFGPAVLVKTRSSGPMLEQVSEDMEAENGFSNGDDENVAPEAEERRETPLQPSLAAHALPLGDDDDVAIEDI